MEAVNDTIEGILNYFVENIKEVQKNDHKGKDVIALLIDLAFNSIQTLYQLGEGDEKRRKYIWALILNSLANIELNKDGGSHE